ncbi:DUF6517 family protein [Haloplanus natans]|uniref:DUF6517 family protein n=1 Tax=Haloplanus natans TaxID=376171 RepID=UPI0006782CE0|nr:DUF6517 family protein [Haloplanus natans]
MRRRHFLASGLAGLVWTAGCGLVPEESDPIEASATAPATLPEAAAAEAGDERIVAETTTVETTVDADIGGDVALSASREVVMTLFRRVYRADGERRFGLVTAPTVRLIGNSETRYDPIPALDRARVVALATDRSVDTVSDATESGAVTMLGTETPRETATATDGDEKLALVRARVRADDDAVTAVALAPTDDAVVAPLGAVARDP